MSIEAASSSKQSLEKNHSWNHIRENLISNHTLWDIFWDLCRVKAESDKLEKISIRHTRALQTAIDEVTFILQSLSQLIKQCCEEVPLGYESDLLSIQTPILNCLNIPKDVQLKVKQADQIDKKISRYFKSLHHTKDAVYQDALFEVKMERSDEDGDYLNGAVDCLETILDIGAFDQTRFEEDKTGSKEAKKKRSPRKVKMRMDPAKFVEKDEEDTSNDDDDLNLDDLDSIDSLKPRKKMKYLSNNEGPPYEHICGRVFDKHNSYRCHVRKCDGTQKKIKPPYVTVDKRLYCGHPDCLPLSGIPGPEQENWGSHFYILRHFSENHASDEQLRHVCTYCPQRFLTLGLLKGHIFAKHEHRYTCKTCGQSFPLATTLRKHERVHTGEKPHKCIHCDAKFSRTNSLRNHERRKHGVFVPNGPLPEKTADQSTSSATPIPAHYLRSHVCEMCGKAFYSKQTLQDHQVTHTGARPYMCPVCGKTLRNDSCLRRHMMCIHGVKHTCEVCGKDFSSKTGFLHHKRDIHGIQF